MSEKGMNSNRPYLLRGLYEWIVDNECTPHILVHSDAPNVVVPSGYASDGRIVLNISPSAVRFLELGNEAVTFEGRFGGVAQQLHIPMGAILAIYARENGQGLVFELEERLEEAPAPEPDEPPPSGSTPPRATGRPSLKVVK